MNEFEEAAKERASMGGGTIAIESPSILPACRDSSLPATGDDLIALRQKLITQYHGAPGLIARLEKEGRLDPDARLLGLLEEIIKETDNLLGNELIVTKNGELQTASIISFKRSEVLEKVSRLVQAKQTADKAGGAFDVNAPEIATIFRYFLNKSKDTLEQIGVSVEMCDLFFRKFGELTENWQKELKVALNDHPRVIP